ncbi:DUF115 domain-containing protein [Gemmiger formicilis]|uniref:6-hydroxymethylpterin diphosphokinase MptE-like protein n=1 Tax=Gemmiger formicilis TaxID=745368 RepID=UPI00195C2E70|nr:6-hydroxymethylpterin diphosphokinase MptE-like protein [Gemmiger formicilis]MBM6899795.1 DUF115 domain-containing protein [Gemmiger formicilis]
MEKYYIWGAGLKGSRMLNNLGKEKVLSFIDNSVKLQNSKVDGIPVISFETYLSRKDNRYIIVTPFNDSEIIAQLEASGVYTYFRIMDCPAHLHSGYPHVIDNSDIFPHIPDGPVLVYGFGLYAALLLDYFRQQNCTQIFWASQKGCAEEFIPSFMKTFGPLLSPPQQFSGTVFAALPELGDEVRRLYPQAKFVDASLESAYAIMKVPFPRLTEFDNLHAGKRCFIVATGPSLKIQDLDVLHAHHEYCISLNHIYKAFGKTAWRPDYYMCGDTMLIRDYAQEIRDMEVPVKFIAWNYPPFWDTQVPDNIYPFLECRYEYWTQEPPFNSNFPYGVFTGYSVTYVCIQFAVYAGFSEIYLIGCDHNYAAPQTGAAGNHFVKDYQEKKVNTPAYQKDKVELAYRSARQYCDTHGIKIYNATRGGKLEVFERVDFDSLFAK